MEGDHAHTCERGRQRQVRHDGQRRATARNLRRHRVGCEEEVRVPEWDRQCTDPRSGETVWERAVLDVRFFDSQGNLTYADVAVVSAGTLSPDTLRQRVERPGRAAAAASSDRLFNSPEPPSQLTGHVAISLGFGASFGWEMALTTVWSFHKSVLEVSPIPTSLVVLSDTPHLLERHRRAVPVGFWLRTHSMCAMVFLAERYVAPVCGPVFAGLRQGRTE